MVEAPALNQGLFINMARMGYGAPGPVLVRSDGMTRADQARREPDQFPISTYGRERLLDAALVLLDAKGIDGASARAIAQASGHRNVAAVNYHFGTRDELVRAVVARHAEVMDQRRHLLLDELEARGPLTPRDGLVAMLRPLVEQLADVDGRRYLRLLNQAINHPAYGREVNIGFASSAVRASVHVAPAVAHLTATHRTVRTQNALGAALYALAAQARQLDARDSTRPLLEGPEFEDELVTSLLGALRAG
jgi:AcrR family transcriptional regulator